MVAWAQTVPWAQPSQIKRRKMLGQPDAENQHEKEEMLEQPDGEFKDEAEEMLEQPDGECQDEVEEMLGQPDGEYQDDLESRDDEKMNWGKCSKKQWQKRKKNKKNKWNWRDHAWKESLIRNQMKPETCVLNNA